MSVDPRFSEKTPTGRKGGRLGCSFKESNQNGRWKARLQILDKIGCEGEGTGETWEVVEQGQDTVRW